MSAARVVAQAKVNLFLHVLAREASGYHQLETLFQRLGLGDDVRLRAGVRGRTLDCRGADVGPVERNLAWRAALAYAAAAGWPDGFAIEIDKRIPVGGGLGGGSADAGAVLRALDALAPQPLGRRLIRVAARLGSDVPFLTLDWLTALGWSRGERLLRMTTLDSLPVLLAVPPFGVATADAYQWLAEDRGAWAPWAGAVDPMELGDWTRLAPLVGNDFESAVEARQPSLREIRERLGASGALLARLSGSGSTVFGVFADPAAAASAGTALVVPTVLTRTASSVVPVTVIR